MAKNGGYRSPGIGPPPRGIASCSLFAVAYAVIAAAVILWLWLWRI